MEWLAGVEEVSQVSPIKGLHWQPPLFVAPDSKRLFPALATLCHCGPPSLTANTGPRPGIGDKELFGACQKLK
jgi:hypothetical protein